jgi:Cof subfamily protein (haloacid dehalogenase superfamily)
VIPRRQDVRALLLDLDGTLLDRQSRVSPRNASAVRAAREAGIEVILATGRSDAATQETYRALDLEAPACCYNGAVLWCGRSDRWIHHLALEDDATHALVEFCRERGLFFVVFRDDWKHTTTPAREDHRAFLDLLDNVRIVDPGEIPRSGATKVSFAAETEDLALFAERFAGRGLYEERFNVKTVPGFEHISMVVVDLLTGRCRGKAEAVHFLEAERAIPREAVVAVGDHRNDLPMLRAAGVGVAMGNASDEVRAAAAVVTGRHDEDGVAELIEAILGG